jgi:DNA-binding MarR family transcriptional regulator
MHEGMRKQQLVHTVVLGQRENNIGAVLFHQAVGQRLGINVSDMKCLDLIVLRGAASPSQLAQLTGLTSGSTTAMLDRLEARKLITRLPNPVDRRGTVVELTKYAQRTLPRLFGSLAHAMERLTATYTEDELSVLLDFFSKATAVWTQERSELLSTTTRPPARARRRT